MIFGVSELLIQNCALGRFDKLWPSVCTDWEAKLFQNNILKWLKKNKNDYFMTVKNQKNSNVSAMKKSWDPVVPVPL